MGRQKTPKLEKFKILPNCFDSSNEDFSLKEWQDLIADKKLVLELGCGKAELSLGLAEKNPEKFYIGVDVKADRLQRGGTISLEKSIKNIVLLRANVDKLADYFEPASIEEIWITFPDPYPKDKHAKRRLVGEYFLNLYSELLVKNGKLHFKTDNQKLFEYGLSSVENNKSFRIALKSNDLHQTDYEDAKIKTTFEKRFLDGGLKIKYLLAEKV